jgi:hypothetical protein
MTFLCYYHLIMGSRPIVKVICGITDLKCDPKTKKIVDPRYRYRNEPEDGNIPWRRDEWKISDFFKLNEDLNDWKPGWQQRMDLIGFMDKIGEKTFEELVFWNEDIGSCRGNLIGISLDMENDSIPSELGYALSSTIPEFMDGKDGFLPMISLSEKENCNYILKTVVENVKKEHNWVWKNVTRLKTNFKDEIYRMNRSKRRIKNGQNYASVEYEKIKRAAVILNLLGLKVKESEIRAFIVCYWS